MTEDDGRIVKWVYLAHSLGLRNRVANEIIPLLHKIAKNDRICLKFDNPFGSRLKQLGNKSNEEINEDKSLINPNWVVGHDLNMIDRCDAVMVYNPLLPTVGSTCEMVYGYIKRKPVGVVCHKGLENHAWYNYHSIVVSSNLEYVVKKMVEFFDY